MDKVSKHEAKVVHLNRKELAPRWGVHVLTLKRWERAGRLKSMYLGPRTIRFPLSYIEELEENGFKS